VCNNWWEHNPARVLCSLNFCGIVTDCHLTHKHINSKTLRISEVIVSDNGIAFTSQEFEAFLKQESAEHIETIVYHPAYNGLANQIMKDDLKKISDGTIESRVARLLCISLQGDTTISNVSPAELLFGRKLWARFDLLLPDTAGCRHTQTYLLVIHIWTEHHGFLSALLVCIIYSIQQW